MNLKPKSWDLAKLNRGMKINIEITGLRDFMTLISFHFILDSPSYICVELPLGK